MKQLILVCSFFLLFSCNDKTVYDKVDKDFPENRWQKSDVKTYTFEITKTGVNYTVEVLFSHIYGYQFSSAPLIAEITYPDGKLVSNGIILQIIGEDGEDLGDCAGDYCDLTQPIINNEPLAVGKYSVKLSHNFQAEFLPNVLGVGIQVKQEFD
jgi:gliding motility-associated lipoprotein GldH